MHSESETAWYMYTYYKPRTKALGKSIVTYVQMFDIIIHGN